MKTSQNSICVLRITALGDCINAFGLVNALKQKNPEADITWVIDKRFSSLFVKDGDTPLVNLEPVDIKGKGLIKATLDLRKALSGKCFDSLYNMQTSIKASVLSLGIKAKKRLGYDDERRRECQGLFINKKINTPKTPHVLSGFIAFAHTDGYEDLKPSWDFQLSETEKNKADELLNDVSDSKVFTISPASAKAEKNWTAEGYAAIADYAVSKGFKVVLVGSPNEKEQALCSKIEELSENTLVNLCGKTSLRVLCAVLSKSSLVMSPDSASMHLASALNIPVIGLFAIHNPQRVGAYNFKDLYVSVYDEAAADELQGRKASWRYRVKDKTAMQRITVEAVQEAFNRAEQTYLK